MNSRQLRTGEAFILQLTACGLQPGEDAREQLWQAFLGGYQLGRSQCLQGSGHWQPGPRALHEGPGSEATPAKGGDHA